MFQNDGNWLLNIQDKFYYVSSYVDILIVFKNLTNLLTTGRCADNSIKHTNDAVNPGYSITNYSIPHQYLLIF